MRNAFSRVAKIRENRKCKSLIRAGVEGRYGIIQIFDFGELLWSTTNISGNGFWCRRRGTHWQVALSHAWVCVHATRYMHSQSTRCTYAASRLANRNALIDFTHRRDTTYLWCPNDIDDKSSRERNFAGDRLSPNWMDMLYIVE